MSDLCYTTEYTILSKDVDPQRRLRLSALFSMLQEAAIEHTIRLGMGREKTLDRGLLWVITLQHAKIERLPLYDEKIVLQTWPGADMHMYFPRYFCISDTAENTLVDVSMVWGLMEAKTRHLVFPEEYGIVIPENTAMPALSFPRAPVMKDLQPAGTFAVPRSYTDINGHMNNTRYFDLAEDTMPSALYARDFCEIRTSFLSEAASGTDIQLYNSAAEDTYLLEGRSSQDKPLFRMSMRIK